MFAAVPLYFTSAIAGSPLIVFHLVMAAIGRARGDGEAPELLPARVMRWMADRATSRSTSSTGGLISRNAIAASTHLVLFIAVYQPIESMQRNNQAQRMLTAALIFMASLATSTHITIVPFVLLFAFVMFRQLMYVSHLETVRSLEHEYAEAPSGRAAAFYLVGRDGHRRAALPVAAARAQPVRCRARRLAAGASTASLTETIDFRQRAALHRRTRRSWRASGWTRRRSPFFTPIRLRGHGLRPLRRAANGSRSPRGLREVPRRNGVCRSRRGRIGIDAAQSSCSSSCSGAGCSMPVGAYAVTGMPTRLYEGPARETLLRVPRRRLVNVRVRVRAEGRAAAAATRVARRELSGRRARWRRWRGGSSATETRPERQAALIEQYMSTQLPLRRRTGGIWADRSRVDDFLLHDRAGHCEYFAAGMVALLTSLDVPARIAGGFYGGRCNPLTGYFAIRREDAHAWVEMWDGTALGDFRRDPGALRPGIAAP